MKRLDRNDERLVNRRGIVRALIQSELLLDDSFLPWRKQRHDFGLYAQLHHYPKRCWISIVLDSHDK